MGRAEKLENLKIEMEKYGVSIIWLNEVRFKLQGQIGLENYSMSFFFNAK